MPSRSQDSNEYKARQLLFLSIAQAVARAFFLMETSEGCSDILTAASSALRLMGKSLFGGHKTTHCFLFVFFVNGLKSMRECSESIPGRFAR